MKRSWDDAELDADVSRELDGPEPMIASSGILQGVRKTIAEEETREARILRGLQAIQRLGDES